MLVKLKRKRTIPAALGILLLVIIILAVLYGSSTIKTVKVTGNSYYTEDEIREILFGTAMDNNTISTMFSFTMNLGATQSAVSAIGIVLTVPIATACCLLFLNKEQRARIKLGFSRKGGKAS